MVDLRNWVWIRQFFSALPLNITKIFAKVFDPYSGCTIYFPGRDEESVKKQKDMLQRALDEGYKTVA